MMKHARVLLPRELRSDVHALLNWGFDTGSRLQQALLEGGSSYASLLTSIQSEFLPGREPSGDVGELIERRQLSAPKLSSIVDGWNVLLVRQRFRDETQRVVLLSQLGASPAALLGELAGVSKEEQWPLRDLGLSVLRAHLLLNAGQHLQLGRCVFPESLLERFGVDGQDLVDHRKTKSLQKLLSFESSECRNAVDRSCGTDADLPESLRPYLKAIALWTQERLQRFEELGFPMFDAPVRLPRLRLARLILDARG
jgi:phytoene/squalene synthetase